MRQAWKRVNVCASFFDMHVFQALNKIRFRLFCRNDKMLIRTCHYIKRATNPIFICIIDCFELIFHLCVRIIYSISNTFWGRFKWEISTTEWWKNLLRFKNEHLNLFKIPNDLKWFQVWFGINSVLVRKVSQGFGGDLYFYTILSEIFHLFGKPMIFGCFEVLPKFLLKIIIFWIFVLFTIF